MEKATPKIISSIELCKPCAVANATRYPRHRIGVQHVRDVPNGPMELWTSDIATVDPPSLGGSRYLISFVDEGTGYAQVAFLKSKDEALDAFKRIETEARNFHRMKLKHLHSDNAGEYISSQFQEHCTQEGIRRTTSTPYVPQENAVAESFNGIFFRGVRAALCAANLPPELWAEVGSALVFTRNMLQSQSRPGSATPHEKWYGKPPPVSALCVIGTVGYVVLGKKLHHLEPRSVKSILIGYKDRGPQFPVQ